MYHGSAIVQHGPSFIVRISWFERIKASKSSIAQCSSIFISLDLNRYLQDFIPSHSRHCSPMGIGKKPQFKTMQKWIIDDCVPLLVTSARCTLFHYVISLFHLCNQFFVDGDLILYHNLSSASNAQNLAYQPFNQGSTQCIIFICISIALPAWNNQSKIYWMSFSISSFMRWAILNSSHDMASPRASTDINHCIGKYQRLLAPLTTIHTVLHIQDNQF